MERLCRENNKIKKFNNKKTGAKAEHNREFLKQILKIAAVWLNEKKETD